MSQAFNKSIMEWDAFPEYDLLYTDPPWGERMVKWFNTQFRKDTGATPLNDFQAIFNQLGRLAHKNKPMVIEYEIKDWEWVMETMIRHGHTFAGKHELTQSMGRPFVVLCFNQPLDFAPDLKGFEIVTAACRQLSARLVFDPFAGIGKTAEAVIKTGASYIGSEYNPKRYEKLKAVIGS